jgi:uncharacterized protein (TIGR03086 family)
MPNGSATGDELLLRPPHEAADRAGSSPIGRFALAEGRLGTAGRVTTTRAAAGGYRPGMTEISDRYRKVADAFMQRVEAVPDDAWDRPAPCEGWVARDVVRHLVQTAGFFLGPAGIEVSAGPSVDDDPVGAWTATRDTVQAALEDPEVAGTEFDSPMGRTTVEGLIGRFGIGDVLVHTWDLARATGLDETLDAEECERLYAVMEPSDELMRKGTAFGPKVEVPDDVDVQTRLIAFTGRRP